MSYPIPNWLVQFSQQAFTSALNKSITQYSEYSEYLNKFNITDKELEIPPFAQKQFIENIIDNFKISLWNNVGTKRLEKGITTSPVMTNISHPTSVQSSFGNWPLWTKTLAPLGKCVILDIETTGLDPEMDDIIQVGALIFDGAYSIPRYWTQFVQTEKLIPPIITEMTGISKAHVSTGIPLSACLRKLKTLLQNSVLIGYNTHKFDIPFLENACKKSKLSALSYCYSIDLLPIARLLRHNTLDNVQQEYAKHCWRADHNAINDCLKCADIMTPLLLKKFKTYSRESLDFLGTEHANQMLKKGSDITVENLLPTPPGEENYDIIPKV